MAASLGEAYINVKASTKGFAKDLSTQLKAVLRDAQKQADVAFGSIAKSAKAASTAATRSTQQAAKSQTKAIQDFGRAYQAAVKAAQKAQQAADGQAAKDAQSAADARLRAFGNAYKAAVASAKAAAKEQAAIAKEVEKAIADAAKASATAARVADEERARSFRRAEEERIAAAKAAAKIIADTRAAEAASAQKGIASVKSASQSLFSTISTGAKFATIGVLALGAALTGIGLQQAGQIQLAQTAFSSLANEIQNGERKFEDFDDAARKAIGDDFVNSLQTIAINSSLAFGTLTSTTQQLLALGFAGDEAKAVVLTVGDALAASGKAGGQLNEDLRGVITAFAQIKGSGRLLAQDLNQITTRVPSATRLKVYNELAKDLDLVSKTAKPASAEMTKARKEVIKLAEAGSIDADLAIKAITTALRDVPGASGALARVNKTLPGQIEEIKETIRLRLGQALLPIADQLAERLGSLGDKLSAKLIEIGPTLQQFALGFADVLEDVLPRVLTVVGQGFGLVNQIITSIGPYLPGLVSGFGDLFEAVGKAVAALVPLAPFFVGIGDAILAVVSIIGPLVGLIGQLASIIPTPVLEAFGAALGSVAVALGVVIAAVKIYTVVQGILDVVLSANPIGLIVAALVALGIGLTIAWQKSETFREIVVGVFGAIANTSAFVIDHILGLLQTLVDAFGSVASHIPFVGDAIGGAFDKASDAIQGARNAANALAGAINAIPTHKTVQVDVVIGGVGGVTDPSDVGKALRGQGAVVDPAAVAAAKQAADLAALQKRLLEESKKQRTAAEDKGPTAAERAAANRAARFKEAIKGILDSIDAEFKNTLVNGTSKQIDTALDSLRKKIRASFIAAKKQPPSALLKGIEEDNKTLKSLATAREKVLDRLAAATRRAQEVAAGVNSFASQAIADTTEKIKAQIADLSRLRIILPGQDAISTPGGTKKQRDAKTFADELKARLKAIKDFQADIQKLIKAGLNKETIDEIISAGVEGGGALADSLAGATKATIDSINDSQTKIGDAADKLGNTAADSLFRAGKNVADGLIQGLKDKRDEIKDAMKSIADDLVAEIKKQLKIASPSRVMAELGGFAGLGLATGLLASAPAVAQAGAALARASVPQLQGMANVEGMASLTGLVGGSGRSASSVTNHRTIQAPITQHINMAPGIDPLVLADALGRSIAGRLR